MKDVKSEQLQILLSIWVNKEILVQLTALEKSAEWEITVPVRNQEIADNQSQCEQG